MGGTFEDRNLLLGVIALQLELVSRDELIEAMHDWALEKRSLGEILEEQKRLNHADHRGLEQLDGHVVKPTHVRRSKKQAGLPPPVRDPPRLIASPAEPSPVAS